MKNIFFPINIIFIIFLVSCGGTKKKLEVQTADQMFKNKQYNEASVEIEKILQKSPENEYAWVVKGNINEVLDKDSVAEKCFLKAIEIEPETEEAYTGLGIIYRKKKQYEKALEYYQKALTINPEYAQAYSSMLVVALKKKDFEKAIEYGLKSYQYDNQDPIISANLSVAYHYIEDSLNRDKYFKICSDLGYDKTDTLKKIFTGELTIFE